MFGVKVGNPVSSSLTLEEFLLILEDVVSTGNLSLNKPPAFSNTGDSDVSLDATPSQYLIFRRLEPSVTEEILAKGAAKLYRPEDVTTVIASNGKISSTSSVANAGAQPGSIQRVLLVRDRRTNESWRYGFVEFATVEVSFHEYNIARVDPNTLERTLKQQWRNSTVLTNSPSPLSLS